MTAPLWTYDFNQPWVVLQNRHKAYQFHIEPLARYRNDRSPHPQWQLVKVCPDGQTCFDELEKMAQHERKKVARYRAIKAGTWTKLRYEIMKRDDFKCQLCGRNAQDGVKLHVDHKRPKSNGGGNSPENLWTLCAECNLGKGVDMHFADLEAR